MVADRPSDPSNLTAERIAGLMLPDDPNVSPDGCRVAFAVHGVSKDFERKRSPSAVWVVETSGDAPARRWTFGPWREHAPRWSPDGGRLAFLSDRAEEGTFQVWCMSASGGEARQLTRWKGGTEQFAWSPDGTRVAFTAPDEEWVEQRREGEKTGADARAWDERGGHRRLRVQDVEEGAPITLGPADRHVTEFAWAPSGHEIAVVLATRPDLEAGWETGIDIVRLPVDGGAPRLVCRVAQAGGGSLAWTRDESRLLFTFWESGAIPSSRALFMVDADGGVPHCLTHGMAACVLNFVRPPASDAVLCTVAEGLGTGIYEIDPESGRRTLRCTPPRTSSGVLGADDAGRVLATVCSAGTEPPELWCGEPETGLRRLSDCNPELRGVHWAEQEPFTWTAPDGLPLDGLVLRPSDGAGPEPGVVLVHGGPYSRWLDGFNCAPGNWAQWLALDGYAVFLPNPRGGMGHGHAFAATVAGEVGMADWRDVASGTDAFLQREAVDAERLGIGGWSQGGFMTAWALSGGIPDGQAERGWDAGYTRWRTVAGDRFRAGISGAGPTDWGAMVSESDMMTFEAMLGGSRPGEGTGPHRHAVVSPLSYAARVRTPLLFLHGRNDERVPVGQAMGFFHELRRRGVPVRLVAYPREGHGILERPHAVDLLGHVRGWYDRWLRDAPR
jgi:dipeptidyl aminopeptidase/acylaminoacyl peptidase